MLTLAWQYLTGRCVATDFADRERAEWPPHPDRVFQALVASWGERGEDPAERKALEWLEAQVPPRLVVPTSVDWPEPVSVYVPVNDTESRQKKYSDKMVALLPGRRDKAKRRFPYVRVGDDVCALVWDVEAPDEHRRALDRVCTGVVRIGHSSSLVCCRLEADEAKVAWGEGHVVLEPTSERAWRKDESLRVAGAGRLATLIAHRKAILDGRIGDTLPLRARELGYVRMVEQNGVLQGAFASPLMVFRLTGGARLDLRQTLEVTQALRHALMPEVNADPALLAFVSGHESNGQPLRDKPHAAFVPLAFVGHEHADGHLLGLALVLPKRCPAEMEDGVCAAIGRLIRRESERVGIPDNEQCRLVLGAKGELWFAPDDDLKRAWNLRSETWCNASCVWATVTPIVMDRMQNARRSDPAGWAADQIVLMCRRQGLPDPREVLVRPVSFVAGAPTVREYPPLPHAAGGMRRMAHVRIRFEQPVAGPLLLGSGRYKGYGFCRPMSDRNGGLRPSAAREEQE